MNSKECTKCKQVKPLDEFHKNKNTSDGRVPRCKACRKSDSHTYYSRNKDAILEKSRAYNQENRELVAERLRRYYDKNRDRILDYHADYRRSNREKVYSDIYKRKAKKACAVPQRWRTSECPDNTCYWCGTTEADEWHIEHVMPISLGGPAEAYNEVVACSTCNLTKNNKHPLVWIAEQF
jgi:hypothetical protein